MQKITHFCSYYYASSVFESLFTALEKANLYEQRIFIPVSAMRPPRKIHTGLFLTRARCLSVFTRAVYPLKVFLYVLSALACLDKGERGNTRIIHAHTLYSDGVPAYLYSLLYGNPLHITLRGTDLNLGTKWLFYAYPIVILALRKAKTITVLSNAHHRSFLNTFGPSFETKTVVIPNGLRQEFIDASLSQKRIKDRGTSYPLTGLYIGNSSKNKNVKKSLHAFSLACANGGLQVDKCRFVIAGHTRDEYESSYGPADFGVSIEFHGPCHDIDELIALYDAADIFVMPSHSETFGLVYLEAISRCTPVIFTKGQGIDGLFLKNQIGLGVDSNSVRSIASGISYLIRMFPSGIGPFELNPVVNFSWTSVAKNHIKKLYSHDTEQPHG